MKIYRRLHTQLGPQRWWPAKTRFEVMIGAILTQNTVWANVEKAIGNLKRKKLLSPAKIERIPLRKLKALIRPSGFYNEKAKKLKSFVRFLNKLKREPTREELLGVKGIGRETADSVLLYAFNKPVFVIDAYTKRIFSRHGFISDKFTYDETQKFFTDRLPKSTKLFNEFHALIVELGKNFCKKKKPKCSICPLKVVMPM